MWIQIFQFDFGGIVINADQHNINKQKMNDKKKITPCHLTDWKWENILSSILCQIYYSSKHERYLTGKNLRISKTFNINIGHGKEQSHWLFFLFFLLSLKQYYQFWFSFISSLAHRPHRNAFFWVFLHRPSNNFVN